MKLSPEVEQYRKKHPVLGSSPVGKGYGYFEIPYESATLHVIAVGSKDCLVDWDHVSVSLSDRCPDWFEMSYVKDLFFDPEETVIQFGGRFGNFRRMLAALGAREGDVSGFEGKYL